MSLFIEGWGISGTKKGQEKQTDVRVVVAAPSLGAHGELLHVMDAVLVNQTDVKGVQVQDEAFVQLQEEDDEEEDVIVQCESRNPTKTEIILPVDVFWAPMIIDVCPHFSLWFLRERLTSSTHFLRMFMASSRVKSA